MVTVKNFFTKIFHFSLLGIANYILFNIINGVTTYMGIHYLVSAFISYGTVVLIASLGNVFVIFKKENTYTNNFKPIVLTMIVYISALFLELVAIFIFIGQLHWSHFWVKQAVYILGGAYCFLLNMLVIFRKRKPSYLKKDTYQNS